MSFNIPTLTSTPESSWGAQVNDNFAFLHSPPHGSVSCGPTSVANNTVTALSQTLTSTGSPLWNGSRIQIPSGMGGTYMISLQTQTTSHTGSDSRLWSAVALNGTASTNGILMDQRAKDLSNRDASSSSTAYKLTAGDYLNVLVFHATGTSAQWQAKLELVMIAP